MHGPSRSARMPLVRLTEPFNHPDRLFEVKRDGFRALVHFKDSRCHLRSRNGHIFKHWPERCDDIARTLREHDAVLEARRLP